MKKSYENWVEEVKSLILRNFSLSQIERDNITFEEFPNQEKICVTFMRSTVLSYLDFKVLGNLYYQVNSFMSDSLTLSIWRNF